MRALKKDEFYPYKKGLRKCNRKIRKLKDANEALKARLQIADELNEKYYQLLDSLGAVSHTPTGKPPFVFVVNRIRWELMKK